MKEQRSAKAADLGGATGSRWLTAADVLFVFLVFFVHAGWLVPDVNEPHYLAKAKHFWDPSWCANDFFLCSGDAHFVFYWTFGWLTQWISLPAVAWLGRILTWSLLAWAWRRLSVTIVPRPLFAALSAALFVALVDRYHLAAEWVVGGVEAKGFAYVGVLLALAALLRGHWNRVWILLGLATAFHVLVGGWMVLLAGWVWMTAGRERPAVRRMLPGLLAGLILALPGLIPAVLLTRGVDPEVIDQANQIYVFQRLPHHLALHTLKTDELVRRTVRYSAQLAALTVLFMLVPPTGPNGRLRWFVLGAVLLVVAGVGLGLATRHDPALAARWLRYYWMRLPDVAVPIGVSLTATAYVAHVISARPRLGATCLACALLAAGLHLGLTVAERHGLARPRADRKLLDYEDWCDACDWIAEHLPAKATFLTPRRCQTFKWRTGRAEVVTHKDIPQDPAAILEWWARIDAVHRYDDGPQRFYRRRLAQQGEASLVEIGRRYHAEYLITTVEPPLRFERLYRNGTYAVYRLPRE